MSYILGFHAVGGSNRTCNKCGEEGHMARECPTGGGGGGSRSCYKCGKEGHISRDCPEGGRDGSNKGEKYMQVWIIGGNCTIKKGSIILCARLANGILYFTVSVPCILHTSDL